jgi:hypothetical protein
MKIYEAGIELGPRFDNRRTMFSARIAGEATDYNSYMILEDRILEIVLEAIALVSAESLTIFYKEYFDDKSEVFELFTSDGLVSNDIFDRRTFSDREEIKQVLRYLCRDLGLITLGQIGKILVIPAERLRFFLCLPSDASFIKPEVIELDTEQAEEIMAIYDLGQVLLP